MTGDKAVIVVDTLDTREPELRNIADRIRSRDGIVLLMDVSV